MKIPKSVLNLCMPAKIYLGLTLISTLCYLGMMFHAEDKQTAEHTGVHTYTYLGLCVKLAFAIVYVIFLNYLCSKGYRQLAWFFLVLPFILMIFFMIIAMFVVSYSVGMMMHVTHQMKDLKDQHTSDIESHDTMKMGEDMTHQEYPQVMGYSL